MSTITTITPRKKNGASATRSQPNTAAPVRVTPDLIRRRAYEIFRSRNGGPGNSLSDWVRAEQELTGASREAAFIIHSPKRRKSSERRSVEGQPFRDGILYG